MLLTSPAFLDRKPIPSKFAHSGVVGGKNISIPLHWSGFPPATASFALSVVDPHPVARNWVHWLVINIPPTVEALAEGASGTQMPPGSGELRNSYGEPGYGGPQPPKGSGPHPYTITLYALKADVQDLAESTTFEGFKRRVGPLVLETALLTGIYER